MKMTFGDGQIIPGDARAGRNNLFLATVTLPSAAVRYQLVLFTGSCRAIIWRGKIDGLASPGGIYVDTWEAHRSPSVVIGVDVTSRRVGESWLSYAVQRVRCWTMSSTGFFHADDTHEADIRTSDVEAMDVQNRDSGFSTRPLRRNALSSCNVYGSGDTFFFFVPIF